MRLEIKADSCMCFENSQFQFRGETFSSHIQGSQFQPTLPWVAPPKDTPSASIPTQMTVTSSEMEEDIYNQLPKEGTYSETAFLILDKAVEKLTEHSDESNNDFQKPSKIPPLVLYKSWVWNHGRLKYGIHGKKRLDQTSWDCNHCRAQCWMTTPLDTGFRRSRSARDQSRSNFKK
jgi:hypothetical protein